MTKDDGWDDLLVDALQALLSMEPDRIEVAESRIRECVKPGGMASAGQVDLEALLPLRLTHVRLTHAAALQAALLWRGCIPQPGYGAAGTVDHAPVIASLCVTG
jgi:hypothetical protein